MLLFTRPPLWEIELTDHWSTIKNLLLNHFEILENAIRVSVENQIRTWREMTKEKKKRVLKRVAE